MSTVSDETRRPSGVATRSRGKLLALAAATVLALYLSFRLVLPFLPALVWAATIAVVTHRASQWVGGRVKSPGLKAWICTAVVAVAIFGPALFVGYFAVQQIGIAVEQVSSEETQSQIQAWVAQYPPLQRAWNAVSQEYNLAKEAPRLLDRLRPGAVAAISAPIYIAAQVALTLFILFFLYRDEEQAVDGLRSVLPLSERETDGFLERMSDTINATIYGVLVVAMIQGFMGGLMFTFLGIPGAVLWGLIMGLLAIIPYLGTFVVWGPTAVFLALQGDYGRAAILAGWGLVAIGLIDNLLYPMLVGKRLRQHTVVAFIAILGGVSLFGVTGVVLGPVVVAIAFFLIDVLRERTKHGKSAERA